MIASSNTVCIPSRFLSSFTLPQNVLHQIQSLWCNMWEAEQLLTPAFIPVPSFKKTPKYSVFSVRQGLTAAAIQWFHAAIKNNQMCLLWCSSIKVWTCVPQRPFSSQWSHYCNSPPSLSLTALYSHSWGHGKCEPGNSRRTREERGG